MIPEELSLEELLTREPGGPVCFLGTRALIIDINTLGLLRREVIETLGRSVAQGLFARFGYAHGWNMAQRMRETYRWRDPHDLERAGGRVHHLAGFLKVDSAPDGGPLSEKGKAVEDSFEASQHLLHLGRSDEPVCWILCGLASGYISQVRGEAIWVREERCVARGDACCQLVGRTRQQWGEAIAPELELFESHQPEVALRHVANSLYRLERRARSRRQRRTRDDDELGHGRLVFRSRQMADTVSMARRAARVDSGVLLRGQTGVGKEEIARLVHDESPRRDGPFVAVNCGALTESLAESELFGHARGAFTGATTDRPGLIEEAHRGTLFLDEIGDLPRALQVKLLRIFEDGSVRRVGENRPRTVDVRIVAATHRDLAQAIADGDFREDLYYRLRVIEIEVPPLHRRPDDILPLARYFLDQAAERMELRIRGLTAAAADQLLRYRWPGNVRELRNAMERGAALAEGSRVEPNDLPPEVRSALPAPVVTDGVQPLADIERQYILAALEAHDGHQSRTAEALGIGKTTLYRKLKQYRDGEGGGGGF